jgi:hypothetical protein
MRPSAWSTRWCGWTRGIVVDASELRKLLVERRSALTEAAAQISAAMADTRHNGLPAATLLDDDYRAAMNRAELRWTQRVIASNDSGELAWDRTS